MPLLDWKPTYAIHVPQLDDQHRRIVDLINSVHDSMKGGGSREHLQDALHRLLDYTTTHFADEEAMMAESGFNRVEEHRVSHAKLIADVHGFCERFERSASPQLLAHDLFLFLKNWLSVHIQQEDREYGNFYRFQNLL